QRTLRSRLLRGTLLDLLLQLDGFGVITPATQHRRDPLLRLLEVACQQELSPFLQPDEKQWRVAGGVTALAAAGVLSRDPRPTARVGADEPQRLAALATGFGVERGSHLHAETALQRRGTRLAVTLQQRELVLGREVLDELPGRLCRDSFRRCHR